MSELRQEEEIEDINYNDLKGVGGKRVVERLDIKIIYD